VRTTRFWDNLYQVHSKSKDWKAKEFKALGAIKPKGRNQDSQKSATVCFCTEFYKTIRENRRNNREWTIQRHSQHGLPQAI
jgi:hypothetical protein